MPQIRKAPGSPGPSTQADVGNPPAHAIVREPQLTDWLRPEVMEHRIRYQTEGCPALWLDGATRKYYGPSRLAPIRSAFGIPIHPDHLEKVDDSTWNEAVAALGPAQPFSRLQWYAALLAGNGELLHAHAPSTRYQLSRWSQQEREFPRHLRIATCMLKSPLGVQEIVQKSGASLAEVNDFLNAGLAIGLITVTETGKSPSEKKGGFLNRFRKRN